MRRNFVTVMLLGLSFFVSIQASAQSRRLVLDSALAHLPLFAIIPSNTVFFFVRSGTVEIQQLIPLAPPPPPQPPAPEPKLCTLIDANAGTGLGPNFQWYCP